MNIFLLAGSDVTSTLLLIIIGAVVLFLIMREVMCWYYKINERLSLQKETNKLLNDVLSHLKGSGINKINKNIEDTINIDEDYSTELLQNIVKHYEQYTKSDVLISIGLLRKKGIAVLPYDIEKIASYFDFKSITKMWVEINDKFSN